MGGTYRVDSVIGHGSFGSVFRATDLSSGRQVALKVLHAEVRHESAYVSRFRREAELLARLQHPNVIAELDFGLDVGGFTYLVMELLYGHGLDRELASAGRLDLRRAARIVLPLCAALEAAHALGIIHRDVKPENVFLHRSGSAETVKLLDFGIAKLLDNEGTERLTAENSRVGTLIYMAPEHFLGEPLKATCDIYSLGAMLYQMLAGTPPFSAHAGNFFRLVRQHLTERPQPLRFLVPELPAEVEDLVLSALAKRPGDRPTPRQIAGCLTRLAGS